MPPRSLHPESLQAIALRLVEIREATGLNQVVFSKLVDITPQAWNNYERARRRISPDDALRLCRMGYATMDFIYRGTMNNSMPSEMTEKIQARRKLTRN